MKTFDTLLGLEATELIRIGTMKILELADELANSDPNISPTKRLTIVKAILQNALHATTLQADFFVLAALCGEMPNIDDLVEE